MLRLVNKARKRYYWIDLTSKQNYHTVTAYHCKQGARPDSHIVYEGDDETAARDAYIKKQIEKVGKGYAIGKYVQA